MIIMSVFKRILVVSLVMVIVVSMISSLTACAARIQAKDLMEGIEANEVEGKELDKNFVANASRFSVDLFKRTAKGGNSLVSPLSVMLALSMTANGADSETLTEMEKVLGGEISINELNQYLYTYANSLPNKEKSKFSISNSTWFRDEERLQVEQPFLQKNADYYGAAAYKSAFDDQTLKDINSWVKEKTDGMIDEILDEISDDAVMYLINAIVFDAEWDRIYNKSDISKDEFTNIDGSKVSVDMMASEEMKFISDEMARGFIKPYKNGDYSFVAILPDENIAINDYIDTLTGESFMNLIERAEDRGVNAHLPQFSYDYKIKMNDALKDMGMKQAFDSGADFSKLGKSTRGNIYIHEVLHKTFISVDERGTKAGAVTKVEITDESAFEGEYVVLNRPFVYAIIDNSTKLPIFIGTVVELGE